MASVCACAVVLAYTVYTVYTAGLVAMKTAIHSSVADQLIATTSMNRARGANRNHVLYRAASHKELENVAEITTVTPAHFAINQ